MSVIPDAKEEYDRKKRFIEEIKSLDRAEYEEIFRIIKTHNVEYSENSNGIFFDVTPIESTVFEQIYDVVLRSKEQRAQEKQRNAILEDALKSVKEQKT